MAIYGPLRLLNTEISVTAANTVYNSTLVRVFAPSAPTLVTLREGGSIVGTVTIPAGDCEVIRKQTTGTIEAGTAVLCVPIAYA